MSTAEIVKLPPLYTGQRLNREEFYRRIEEWERAGKSVRGIERLEGVVYMPAAAIRMDQHGEPQLMIATWLGVYMATTPGVQGGGSATSKLGDDNDPESDAVLRIRPGFGGQSHTDERGYITGAPELLVEITGSTQDRDLKKKFNIYRDSGVREYLVWETIAEEFYWFLLNSDEYVRQTPDESQILRSRDFPGLWLDVNALLDCDLAKVLQVVQQGIATDEHKQFVAQLAAQRQAAP